MRSIKPIGYIKTSFPTKFGLPRQSGLVSLISCVVLDEKYSAPECVRGLEEYSHIWLIWDFSEVPQDKWSPTVRPPRLGGNKRMGVFATRSPYRPNPFGLSCVKLCCIEHKNNRTHIYVEGADMMDGTPIYDIKPYLTFTDSRTEAVCGFADGVSGDSLAVEIPEELENRIPHDKLNALCEILSQDPRPHYQDDPDRIYGFPFEGYEIKFTVRDGTLTVTDII